MVVCVRASSHHGWGLARVRAAKAPCDPHSTASYATASRAVAPHSVASPADSRFSHCLLRLLIPALSLLWPPVFSCLVPLRQKTAFSVQLNHTSRALPRRRASLLPFRRMTGGMELTMLPVPPSQRHCPRRSDHDTAPVAATQPQSPLHCPSLNDSPSQRHGPRRFEIKSNMLPIWLLK